MKKKISVDQEQTPQEDMKKQLLQASHENQLLREMSNLNETPYYRLQLITLLTKISESLETLAQTPSTILNLKEDFQLGVESENEETNKPQD